MLTVVGDNWGIVAEGDGATITGNTISLVGTEFGISIDADNVTVNSNRIVGASSPRARAISNTSSTATIQSNTIGGVGYAIGSCNSVPRSNIIFDSTYGITSTAAAASVNTFVNVTTPLTVCP